MSEEKDEVQGEDNKDVYVNQKSIAYLFGITPRNFAEWNVAPVGTKGREAFYSVKQVIAYAKERWSTKKTPLVSRKERLLKLQAEKLELEVLERQGSLFPREVVEAVWSEQITHFRLKILSIPSRMSQGLSHLKDPNKIKKRLTEALSEALEELSKYNYADYHKSYRKAETNPLTGTESASKKA